MNCPKCEKPMLIKETLDSKFDKIIKIAVCNNFKDCDFDEEIEVTEKDDKIY